MKQLFAFLSIGAATMLLSFSSCSSDTETKELELLPVIETFGPEQGNDFITQFNNDRGSIDINRDGQIDITIESMDAPAWKEIKAFSNIPGNAFFTDPTSNKIQPFYEGNSFGDTKRLEGLLYKQLFMAHDDNAYLFNQGQTGLLGVYFKVQNHYHIGYVKLKREGAKVTIYETAWNKNPEQQMYL